MPTSTALAGLSVPLPATPGASSLTGAPSRLRSTSGTTTTFSAAESAASAYRSGRFRSAAIDDGQHRDQRRLRRVQPHLVAHQRLAEHAELEQQHQRRDHVRRALVKTLGAPSGCRDQRVISRLPGRG